MLLHALPVVSTANGSLTVQSSPVKLVIYVRITLKVTFSIPKDYILCM